MSILKSMIEKVVAFRDDRDWKQFHNPKDCAISLSLEASEFLEHFQWKNAEEVQKHLEGNLEDVSDELADVLYWVLLISHDLDIDLEESLNRKLKKSGAKYPIEKSKGRHTKYTDL